MKTDEKIEQVIEELYRAYGSGTGVLFGIPSSLKSSVRAVVKVVLTISKEDFMCSIDGNALSIVKFDFINLAESPAVFIELTEQQIQELKKLGDEKQ